MGGFCRLRFIDGHCDVLYKLWEGAAPGSFYDTKSGLDVTYPAAKSSRLALQVFAIYVPEEVPRSQRWHVALQQIDQFYEAVVRDQEYVIPITSQKSLAKLEQEEGPIGGLLLLEGVDALQGELHYLRILHRLGVRQVGLTWNYANEAADGVEEERGGGLSRFGQQLVMEMRRLSMILDVSHLSLKGFWDVMEIPELPVVASHSNCYAVCPHKRNLGDDQIRALIARDGRIGITFVPKFVRQPASEATLDDLLYHIDHVCSLGGENHLTFGSDFDGIDDKIPKLENIGQLYNLIDQLLARYPAKLVQKWSYDNWYRFYNDAL